MAFSLLMPIQNFILDRSVIVVKIKCPQNHPIFWGKGEVMAR